MSSEVAQNQQLKADNTTSDAPLQRQGRHYRVIPQRGKHRFRVRYQEGNQPTAGCRLCSTGS